MEFKNSKTYKNLMKAFAGESQARNKYTYYASKAKKEGYEQISEIFTETADNEKEHAKLWFKALHDNDVPSTKDNLLEAANGEFGEWSDMYKKMAEEAKEEGYDLLAFQFDGVAKIEKTHEERYRKLLENLNKEEVFKKGGEVVWVCRNCGHVYVGKEAPKACPVCAHPQSYFEIRKENF